MFEVKNIRREMSFILTLMNHRQFRLFIFSNIGLTLEKKTLLQLLLARAFEEFTLNITTLKCLGVFLFVFFKSPARSDSKVFDLGINIFRFIVRFAAVRRHHILFILD